MTWYGGLLKSVLCLHVTCIHDMVWWLVDVSALFTCDMDA